MAIGIHSLALVTAIIIILGVTMSTPVSTGALFLVGTAQAQEETEKSGDLTAPEGNVPFGGDTVGTYTIGQDRYGLKGQVDMDESPTNGTSYEAWLVNNATGQDFSLGQLVDNALATTKQVQGNTDLGSFNLIEVTEESDINPTRNQSAIVGGAELEG
jgi:hypothetical protein